MNELLALMHDTMSKTARIQGAVMLLKSPQDNGREYEEKLLGIIETSADELNKVLDVYYLSQKEINEKR